MRKRKIDGYAEWHEDVYNNYFEYEIRENGLYYYPYQLVSVGAGSKYGYPQYAMVFFRKKKNKDSIKEEDHN